MTYCFSTPPLRGYLTLQLIQLPLLLSYASYNYSAPRLPAGFKFSKILRAVTNQVK